MIRVQNLQVRVGTFSLDGVSFEVPSGVYAILMGRTGVGKTTLLEAICGLKPVSGGSIELMGRTVTHLKPAERGIGFVPQDGALFATMTVREQIGFALVIRKWARRDIDKRVMELAELLGVTDLWIGSRSASAAENGNASPWEGRLPLGPVLCLDEPLSALDDATRDDMYQLMKSVQAHTGVTTLHITHSRTEARRLGDIVLRLEQGQVQNVSSAFQSDKRDPESRHRPTQLSETG